MTQLRVIHSEPGRTMSKENTPALDAQVAERIAIGHRRIEATDSALDIIIIA